MKDRHLLAEDKSLRDEAELHLTNVDVADDGRYVCQMSNELGSFEQPVDLHISGTYTHVGQDTSASSSKLLHSLARDDCTINHISKCNRVATFTTTRKCGW